MRPGWKRSDRLTCGGPAGTSSRPSGTSCGWRPGTTSRRRAPAAPAWAEVVEIDLDEPPADSVEAKLRAAGPVVADLWPLRSTADAPQRIRNLDGWTEVPVADAFDLVAVLPAISPLPPDQR